MSAENSCEVQNTDWEDLFASKSSNERWEIFKQRYHEWIEKYIPIKTVKCGQRHKPPWINYRSVKRIKKSKRAAAVKARKTGLYAHQEELDRIKSQTDRVIQDAKVDYETKLIDKIKTDPKKFFNYARHFSRSSATVEVLENNGNKTRQIFDCAQSK